MTSNTHYNNSGTVPRARGRPASASSVRSSGNSHSGTTATANSTGVFDPTAYQREREARLQQTADAKLRRERRLISHSPTTGGSGRDSWIPTSTGMHMHHIHYVHHVHHIQCAVLNVVSGLCHLFAASMVLLC
jgi:hypothetical protein